MAEEGKRKEERRKGHTVLYHCLRSSSITCKMIGSCIDTTCTIAFTSFVTDSGVVRLSESVVPAACQYNQINTKVIRMSIRFSKIRSTTPRAAEPCETSTTSLAFDNLNQHRETFHAVKN